jgi:hypothetical protein
MPENPSALVRVKRFWSQPSVSFLVVFSLIYGVLEFLRIVAERPVL